jgi:integrase
MNRLISTIGNEIDVNTHDPAYSSAISPPRLHTLKDLLEVLKEDPHAAMLMTTAGHVSACLDTPIDHLLIGSLIDLHPRLTSYLEGRRHKRNAIRSYRYYAGLLLRRAKELGWTPAHPEVPERWKSVLAAAKKRKGCQGVVHYAIREGRSPLEVGDDHLEAWGEMMLKQRRSYRYVEQVKRDFRSLVLERGLAHEFPRLSVRSTPYRYATPFAALPALLRAEASALMKWKTDVFAPGRPQKARIRAITAKEIKTIITRLYAHVIGAEPQCQIQSIPDLLTDKRVVSFVAWSLNERKIGGATLVTQLARLRAALKHPMYKTHDFSWLDALLMTIPQSSESERLERKARKYLPYDALSEIPEKMRDKRRQSGNLNPIQTAFLVHDELLLRWLLSFVWRSRNVRECRIDFDAAGRNLFRGEIPPLVNIAVPGWVQRELNANPRQQFWQFYFRTDETKTGNEVRGIVPRRLVALLEDYLQHHRPRLLQGRDTATLFLNRKGTALTGTQLGLLISNLTLRYSGRRVTPHLFRDIFAFKWLEDHPEDYLTVSRALWHTNIETTLQVYGRRFDESHALRRVEEWLDGRTQGPEQGSDAVVDSRELGEHLTGSPTVERMRSKRSSESTVQPKDKKEPTTEAA